MHPLRPRLLVTLLLLMSGLLETAALAADGDAAREAELRRKAQEVEKLKDEVRRAQSDLKKLEAENQRLRKEDPLATPPDAAPSTDSVKPVPAIATPPPLEAGQVVEIRELVGQFAAQPEAARQRYAKQRLSVKGTVTGFDCKLLTRRYDVRFESPERGIAVVCRFRLPDVYTAVYTKRSGQALAARVGERTEVPLLEVGDAVIVEGTCKGLKKGELTFSRCQVLK